MVIHTDFADEGSSFKVCCDLVSDGRQHTARSAPGGPEIDQGRLRLIQHLVLESASLQVKGWVWVPA